MSTGRTLPPVPPEGGFRDSDAAHVLNTQARQPLVFKETKIHVKPYVPRQSTIEEATEPEIQAKDAGTSEGVPGGYETIGGVRVITEVPKDPLTVIKQDLEGWREVLLPLNNVLNWDKPVYPGIIVGCTTVIFLLIWYFEPSVLTTFSLIGLTLSLVDFLVPLVAPAVLGGKKWTGTQEKQYEQICIRIHNFRFHVRDAVSTMVSLKNERPKVYFLVVMGFLALFAWVGSIMDNLLLTYLILNLMLLMPGMRGQRVIQGYMNKAADIFKALVLGKSKKK